MQFVSNRWVENEQVAKKIEQNWPMWKNNPKQISDVELGFDIN